jgi:hypothetical protein
MSTHLMPSLFAAVSGVLYNPEATLAIKWDSDP